MNAHAERFVRTVRNECLDHFIIFTQAQLGSILRQFMRYCNGQRPHMGIGGNIPQRTSPPQASGAIRKTPVLGGLHNHYFRAAS
jgi:putative transposase